MLYSIVTRVIILAFSLLSVFVYQSCVSEECENVGVGYLFEIPVTLSPTLETYIIGDTIFIKSHFDDLILEKNLEKDFLLKNFLFLPTIYLFKLDTVEDKISALNDFDVILPPNSKLELKSDINDIISLDGNYNYNNEYYILEYKLIPKKRGLYYFSHGCYAAATFPGQEFEGKCPNKELNDICVSLNKGSQNNIDLMKKALHENYHTWTLEKPEERFHRRGSYCFYVE